MTIYVIYWIYLLYLKLPPPSIHTQTHTHKSITYLYCTFIILTPPNIRWLTDWLVVGWLPIDFILDGTHVVYEQWICGIYIDTVKSQYFYENLSKITYFLFIRWNFFKIEISFQKLSKIRYLLCSVERVCVCLFVRWL